MPKQSHPHHLTARFRVVLAVLLFGLLSYGSFLFASSLSENQTATDFILSYGYLGVFILAIIGGLNLFVPIPAATFVPIFTEAGLFLPLIVVFLVIGTTIADLIGYWLGTVGRDFAKVSRPKLVKRLTKLRRKHRRLTIPVVAAYAALVPLPNELLLIPLAVMGVKLRILLPALILGTIVSQTILAYGFQNVFTYLF